MRGKSSRVVEGQDWRNVDVTLCRAEDEFGKTIGFEVKELRPDAWEELDEAVKAWKAELDQAKEAAVKQARRDKGVRAKSKGEVKRKAAWEVKAEDEAERAFRPRPGLPTKRSAWNMKAKDRRFFWCLDCVAEAARQADPLRDNPEHAEAWRIFSQRKQFLVQLRTCKPHHVRTRQQNPHSC